MTHRRHTATATATTAAVLALLGLAAPTARASSTTASGGPGADTPDRAVTAPAALDTLSRFFARDGAVSVRAAHPRIEGRAVPVRVLSPDFVAGRPGAPVARVEFHAAKAVSSDGQRASVWAVRQGAKGWQVVNIATGDDETRYATEGARRLPGGTVFREPQIDAWYVHQGSKVLPLDEDAIRAVGTGGTTLAAYQDRVEAAYGDKLPGSAYAVKGKAGGYTAQADPAPAAPGVTGADSRVTDADADADARADGGPAHRSAPAAVGTAAVVAALALAGALTGALIRRSRPTPWRRRG
ncbi:hypothetical protein [Streptomyces sp. NPDC006368]|uniref:hypothetical protein n=1 Tax=Streptomyces sp. NPDC006368 TaxID=3156760 RepID=UPI0033A56418